MKKSKVLALLLTGVLALSTAMTVFATEPGGGTVVDTTDTTVDSDTVADSEKESVVESESESVVESESESAAESESESVVESESESVAESETESETTVPVTDIITSGAYVHSYFGSNGVFDHSKAKPCFNLTLAVDATVTWTIYLHEDGETTTFYTNSSDLTAGSQTLTWYGVDANGWHPAGSSSKGSNSKFTIVVTAVAADGSSETMSVDFTYNFQHSFKDHAGYVEPETQAPVNNDVPKTGAGANYAMLLTLAVLFGSAFIITRKVADRA